MPRSLRSFLGLAGLGAALGLLAPAARADEVVLANGDRLTGRLERQGEGFVLRHEVLGALVLGPQALASHPPAPAGPADLVLLAEATAPAPVARDRPAARAAPDVWLVGSCGCEPTAADPCASPWSGHAGLALGLAEGNTEKLDVFADAHVAYARGASKVLGEADYKYGESRGTRTADHWHGKVRYDHAIGPRSYAFAQALFERDELAGQEYRIHGLAGYGRKVWQTRRAELKAEVGAGAVWERYLARARTFSPSAYAGLDFCRRWEDGGELTASLDYLPNLEDHGLSSLILDARYTRPLSGTLDLVIGLRVEHTLEPPAGVEETDLFLNLGLRVKF